MKKIKKIKYQQGDTIRTTDQLIWDNATQEQREELMDSLLNASRRRNKPKLWYEGGFDWLKDKFAWEKGPGKLGIPKPYLEGGELQGTYTKSAQSLINEHELDPMYIEPKNPNGRIYKSDVLNNMPKSTSTGFPNATSYNKLGNVPRISTKMPSLKPNGRPKESYYNKTSVLQNGNMIQSDTTSTNSNILQRSKQVGDWRFGLDKNEQPYLQMKSPVHGEYQNMTLQKGWTPKEYEDIIRMTDAQVDSTMWDAVTPRQLKSNQVPSKQVGGKLLTYKNNPEYFDNRANYSDNAQYSDLVRKKVYAGTHGFNPETGELQLLGQQEQVDPLIQAYSKRPSNLTKEEAEAIRKEQSRRYQENSRRVVDPNSFEAKATNAVTTGVTTGMEVLGVPGAAIVEGISGATGQGFNLKNVLPTVMGGNQKSLSSVAHIENPYLAFAVDTFVDPASLIPGAAIAKKLKSFNTRNTPKPLQAKGLHYKLKDNPNYGSDGKYIGGVDNPTEFTNPVKTLEDANRDLTTFSNSPYNRTKLESFRRPNENFGVSNADVYYHNDPRAKELFKNPNLELVDEFGNIDNWVMGNEGRYSSSDFGSLDDLAVIYKHMPAEKKYNAAIHEGSHSRSVRLPATEAERKILDTAWGGLKEADGSKVPKLEAEAVQGELRMLLGDVDGSKVFTETDIPAIENAMQELINSGHPYIQDINDFNTKDILHSLNKIGLAGMAGVVGTSALYDQSQTDRPKGQYGIRIGQNSNRFNVLNQPGVKGGNISIKTIDENDMLPLGDSDRLSYRDKPVGIKMVLSKSRVLDPQNSKMMNLPTQNRSLLKTPKFLQSGGNPASDENLLNIPMPENQGESEVYRRFTEYKTPGHWKDSVTDSGVESKGVEQDKDTYNKFPSIDLSNTEKGKWNALRSIYGNHIGTGDYWKQDDYRFRAEQELMKNFMAEGKNNNTYRSEIPEWQREADIKQQALAKVRETMKTHIDPVLNSDYHKINMLANEQKLGSSQIDQTPQDKVREYNYSIDYDKNNKAKLGATDEYNYYYSYYKNVKNLSDAEARAETLKSIELAKEQTGLPINSTMKPRTTYRRGGNVAQTNSDFSQGLNKGVNVFPFGREGLKKMTMTPESGNIDYPVHMTGYTNGVQTDNKLAQPGQQEIIVNADTIVETPDLSHLDFNEAFDYANKKKLPIFMFNGTEIPMKKHMISK